MRKEYGKVLRRVFEARIRAVAPQFQKRSVKSLYFCPGDRAYGWRVNEDATCWIVLSPSQKDYDEFTILVGWSTQDRYPELSMVPCAEQPTEERNEFAKAEYLTRLPFLCENQSQWWVVREYRGPLCIDELQASLAPISASAAERQVIPVVDDAIRKLVDLGLPYLSEFARFVQQSRG